uniref:Uncharacterized protein n=1 Tax=Cannabis sativa TaxID=3483 RepID=A0A803Q8N4_CANSA
MKMLKSFLGTSSSKKLKTRVGESVSELGDVLVVGQDYVEEECEEAWPLTTKGKKGPWWVSPSSILTYKRLTNVFNEGLLEGVETFLPHLGQLATNPGEGLCAWSGPMPNKEVQKEKTKLKRHQEPVEQPIRISDDPKVAVHYMIPSIGRDIRGSGR